MYAEGGRLPGLWRRRGPLGPAGDVQRAGRALQRGAGRPGPEPDEQAVERVAADPAAGRPGDARGRRRPDRRSRTAGSCRGWSAPRREVAERIERFDFSRAALELYDFIYGELCDWYLELVKPRLYDGDPATAATLLHVLTETVAMAHPMIPFVTEEIYVAHPRCRGAAGGACRRRPSGRRRQGRGGRGRARADDRRGPGGPRPGATRPRSRPSAMLPARLRRRRLRGDRRRSSRGSPDAVARRRRADGDDGDATRRSAAIAIPGGMVEILPRRRGRPRAPPTASARPGSPSSRPRSRAPRASSPTRASSPRRRRRSSRPSATSSLRLQAELEAL